MKKILLVTILIAVLLLVLYFAYLIFSKNRASSSFDRFSKEIQFSSLLNKDKNAIIDFIRKIDTSKYYSLKKPIVVDEKNTMTIVFSFQYSTGENQIIFTLIFKNEVLVKVDKKILHLGL